MATRPDHEIAIVGAGFSGIGTAIALDRAGFRDWRILEEADGVGGTWHWNTYPGVAVDIPSFSYEFSFEPGRRWSRVYAPGGELKAYAEHCAERYGLRDRIAFGVRVAGAAWDEGAGLWRIRGRDGSERTARHLVNATGVLTEPKRPDIPGLDDFAGDVVHTARWDHGLALAGRRVGIIGTGASAVQVIPAIAPDVAHLTVFQRTPIWCLPKPDAAMRPGVRRALRGVPGLGRAARAVSQAFVEVSFPLAAHYHRQLGIAGRAEKVGRRFLAEQVHDPVTRERLTPRYAVGCKRPSFHNGYLATFNLAHVALETTSVERITPGGVRTADGVEHPLDVLVTATGFKVFDPGNLPTFPLAGAGGIELHDWWAQHRHQAYEGVSVPGFPNLFTIFGPYGYNGSSYFNLIEMQARHVVRCLARARSERATRIEVRPEANERYFRAMLARRGGQVFWQPSCAAANSYYFDQHGDVPLRPATSLEVAWRSRRFPLDDYAFA